MTLTVRLDAATEAALERYCVERGVTKSLVVQESLAVYLVNREDTSPAAGVAGRGARSTSENYKAFDAAGLIGAGELGGASATKPVVRERVVQAITQRRARRGGS